MNSDNSFTPVGDSSPGNSGGVASITLSSVISEIQGLKDKFKNDDEEHVSPFQGLDKASVLQETKIFSDANMVTKQPRKCCQLITKLLHILTRGEVFTSTETTDVFFGVTKLFQSKDANLRRMIYLFIKEVAEATSADEVIIVTQSLTKDMNSEVDLYRANAIRVLCRIIDGSMLAAIERYIKQAIVDRNLLVTSCALVSGIHLIKKHPEVVRRWVNEVSEAVNSQYDMVQYQALSLLYKIKQHDNLAITKLVTQLQKQNLRSPLAVCLLIRYTAELIREDMSAQSSRQFYAFLESMLRHKNEMVVYEAAREICSLPVEGRDLSPAMTVLQLFLSSPKQPLRFAAVRTLNKVAMTQPMIVAKCNDEMETLISDVNRSIATLAITTLLRTGAESSVDRLMKQISSFMGEIADEFKIVVVNAIRSLCLKYPQKHRVLLNFLANILREEGGYDFKRAIADAILHLIQKIPESKEVGLLHLCEFIEDCEFTQLSTKILHVLGELGPSTTRPSRYIRFIYNRIILENAAVRASAVSALAQFATRVGSLKDSISMLLSRCTQDDDDEVRDRAALYVSIIANHPSISKPLLNEPLGMHVLQMQSSLSQYKLRPAEGPVLLDTLPHVDLSTAEQQVTISPDKQYHEKPLVTEVESVSRTPQVVDHAELLYSIPEFAQLGQLFRSCPPVELTEAETEYVVSCIKHVFQEHVVLQFLVQNTVNDQLLRNMSVSLHAECDGIWELECEIPLPELKYGDRDSCFVCLRHLSADLPPISFSSELRFHVHEVDPSTGEVEEDGFEEEYPMEDLELSAADFMAKVQVPAFRSAWEMIGDDAEVRERYQLGCNSLKEGVASVIDYLGLQACDNTASPQPRAKVHILLLSGVFVGGVKVLVKSKLSMDDGSGHTLLQMAVRSEDIRVSQLVAQCIR